MSAGKVSGSWVPRMSRARLARLLLWALFPDRPDMFLLKHRRMASGHEKHQLNEKGRQIHKWSTMKHRGNKPIFGSLLLTQHSVY